MRLIDADILEKEGWYLTRTVTSGKKGYHEIKELSKVETVIQTCELIRQCDIVKNNNNNSYGIVIDLMPDKNSAKILELSTVENRMFVNCPPLAALEKTGTRLDIPRLMLTMVQAQG